MSSKPPDGSPSQVDTAISVKGFMLPPSSLLSEATRAKLALVRRPSNQTAKTSPGTSLIQAVGTDEGTRERRQTELFYETPFYKNLRSEYPVSVIPQEIGGVLTEVVTPLEGIAPSNRDRLLINLHGGHFMNGSRRLSHLESIPIASLGRCKVISVDYRMAPAHCFPVASEDVAAVYRAMIDTCAPDKIGLFGSSAGGLLAAQSIAWFQKEELPLPGAIAMLAGAASYYQDGDSAPLASAIDGFDLDPVPRHPYFRGVDAKDPLAFPFHSPEVMAKFPPSLLVASTRDVALSSVVATHNLLRKLGVPADLLVWEGLDHTFYLDPRLPDSRDVHMAVVKFFSKQLNKAR